MCVYHFGGHFVYVYIIYKIKYISPRLSSLEIGLNQPYFQIGLCDSKGTLAL